MIDIKSDLDNLEQLAADFHSDGHAQTAVRFRRAVKDIQNLRDYAAQLEKSIHQMSDIVLYASDAADFSSVKENIEYVQRKVT